MTKSYNFIKFAIMSPNICHKYNNNKNNLRQTLDASDKKKSRRFVSSPSFLGISNWASFLKFCMGILQVIKFPKTKIFISNLTPKF